MTKRPFNLDSEFRKFDPTDIDAPLALGVRKDQTRAFRVVGLALLVVFCSALSVVLTSSAGPFG